MAKKFPSGQCVHCTKEFEELTSDHVFPRSWYPDSTPLNIEKWQVPACRDCNNEYGRLEEDLLLQMGVCLTDTDRASLGIGTRVVKSVDPRRAKNERDERIRLKKGMRLIEGLRAATPGRPFLMLGSNPSGLIIQIPRKSLERIGEKLIRGIVYLELASIIGKELKVVCDAIPRPEDALVDALIDKVGTAYDRGPGIEILWARDNKRPPCGFFRITLFGKFVMRGAVVPMNQSAS